MAHQSTSQTAFARTLRRKDNEAEEALWHELRARRLNGFKFVRELPVGSFFADFACRSERLIVEVDGSQHVESEHDERRDSWLNEEGWSVLRFSNRMVLAERTAVLATILEVLEGRLTGKAEVNGWRYWPRTRNQAFPSPRLGGEGARRADEGVNGAVLEQV
jgi:very-short-patch-repair endonuclease